MSHAPSLTPSGSRAFCSLIGAIAACALLFSASASAQDAEDETGNDASSPEEVREDAAPATPEGEPPAAEADDPAPEADAQPAEEEEEDAAPQEPLPPRREVPRYDGREPAGADGTDAALWIPRVITSPLYFVAEFVLRRPIGWLLTEIERTQAIQILASVLTFGPEHNIGIFPTVLFEFGLLPSVGLYGFWNKFIIDENRISAHAATWGEDWLSLTVADRLQLGTQLQLYVSTRLAQRPDAVFGGIGSTAADNGRARFGSAIFENKLGVDLVAAGPFSMHTTLTHRSVHFYDSSYGGSPTIPQWSAQRGLTLPVGYLEGYQSLGLRVVAAIDTRAPNGLPQGGVRFELRGGEHGVIDGPLHGTWFSAGGELQLAADLGNHHVIGLRGEALTLIRARDDAQIPFFELIDPGGLGPLRGFLPGLLRGESAGAVVLDYAWPIWVFLNGRIHVACGNAFDTYFRDFALERTRLSFGIGIEPRLGGEHPFELQFALGTSTFENGASVESVRLVFGVRNSL